jgi:hypothetical protein
VQPDKLRPKKGTLLNNYYELLVAQRQLAFAQANSRKLEEKELPPAFSIASVTSAAAAEDSINRHSAGPRPFVPGLALRGRFRANARFTIAGTPF